MLRSSLLIALSLCLSAGVDARATHGSSRTLALYSWQPHGGHWHYVFLADEINHPTNAVQIIRSPVILVGEAALKARVASLPRGQQIAWRDDPLRHILKYPPLRIRQEVTHFAEQHHVQIQILPTAD